MNENTPFTPADPSLAASLARNFVDARLLARLARAVADIQDACDALTRAVAAEAGLDLADELDALRLAEAVHAARLRAQVDELTRGREEAA